MKQIIALALFVSPLFAFGQSTTTDTQPISASTSATADTSLEVASINLSNAQITKLSTSTYSASFMLSSSGEKQEGIRYAFFLAQDDGTPVATYSFDRVLSLEKGSSTLVTEQIDVPKGLSGKFALIVRALTENGLPLGAGIAGTIELKDVELVKISDCVSDEEGYKENEILKITCTVKETKKGALSSMDGGGYILKAKAFYSNNPKESQSAIAEIANGKGTLELRGLNTPGSYTIYTTLAERNGSAVGKEFDTLFTVKGVKVSVKNMTLNKDAYKAGESALATITLDVVMTGVSPLLTLSTELIGKDGACGAEASREPENGSFQMMLPITKDCINPTLSLSVTDPANIVLASSTLSLTSKVIEPILKTPEPVSDPQDRMIYGGTGALGLLFGLLAVFIARKRATVQAVGS